MAETLYWRNNGTWYTQAGMEDFLARNPDTTATFQSSAARGATVARHTVTVKPIDGACCTLCYCHLGGTGTSRQVTDAVDTRKMYREIDGAASALTYPVYYVNGSPVAVYGAHPAFPGFSYWHSRAAGSVRVVSADAARYAFIGGATCEEGVYDSAAAGLKSGTAYAAGAITYSNSDGLLWFGADVALDRSFVVLCGYRWFAAYATLGMSFAEDLNPSTRTVASGKKRALVTDIEDYNGGSNASLATRASTSSSPATFPYARLFWQNRAPYEQAGGGTRVTALSKQTADGATLVLRSVNTKADFTGASYRVGDYIADLATRRPSLETYDYRATLYPVWATLVTVAVEAHGGAGASAIYYADGEGFFADALLTERVAALAPYTKGSAQFLGLYTEDSTASTRAVGPDGAFADGWAPEGDRTLYAQWRTVVEVTLDNAGGAGGASALWYDSGVGTFVLPNTEEAVASVAAPRVECFLFRGYFTEEGGLGTQCIGADGALLPALTDAPPSAAVTLHAHFERVSWKAALDPRGGAGGDGAVYCDGVKAEFYRDELLTMEADAVEPPERAGYSFGGYFTEEGGGGTQCIDAGGVVTMDAFASALTLHAHWTARTYTATFDYAGGSGAEGSRAVTYGQPIGALPTPVAPAGGYEFGGWTLGGAEVAAETPWPLAGDGVVLARWVGNFGDVTDYFGLASPALVPVSSDSGESRPRVAARHYGNFTDGAVSARLTWINPTVTYMVVKDTTLDVTLGRAYAAAAGRTGYMITSVRVATAIGRFPAVTVYATANEGADAINKYRFVQADGRSYGVPVLARARPQALLDSVAGGQLQALTLTLACDPVVLAEGLVPCASDIVDGRIEVQAEALATSPGEDVEVAGGFTRTDAPQSGGGTDYRRRSVKGVKEL